MIRLYSVTSLAATSDVGGIVRPSAFAVLTLMARLHLVAGWTEKSLGALATPYILS
jgi:hypothetical protein